MRVRRDLSSIPYRSASDTWQRIVDLVIGPNSVDALQIVSAAGVMGSIITDEHPATRAIILEGVGPQLRIYCRYGMKAIEEAGNVESLTWNPTAGDWTMHVPCDADNFAWVKAALAQSSPRIRVFDIDEPEENQKRVNVIGEKSRSVVVDWNVRG